MRPTRVCPVHGCPQFEPCPTHPRQERAPDNPERGSSTRRGYGGKWRLYSESYRAKHPWCRPCLEAGRRTPGTAVDHIIPVTGPDDPRFWDRANHQTICTACHAAKTASEGRTSAAGRGGDSIVFA